MGSCKFDIKLRNFKWKREGYREVMNGGACQSLLFEKAWSIANNLNAQYGEDGYEAHRKKGKLANGCVISTRPEAMDDELKSNRLLGALGSSR